MIPPRLRNHRQPHSNARAGFDRPAAVRRLFDIFGVVNGFAVYTGAEVDAVMAGPVAGASPVPSRPATDDRGRVRRTDDGRPVVEAALDCLGVDEPFQDHGIDAELIVRARQRAAALQCAQLRLNTNG